MELNMRLLLLLLMCTLCPLAVAQVSTPPPAAAASSVALPVQPLGHIAPATAARVDHVAMAAIRTFTRAYALIKQAYVDKVDNQRLMQAAIHGMLSNLDPHSAFLEHDDLASLTEDTSGAYAGVGVVVVNLHGQLRVIAPIDDTPAARAGIRAGDIIISIDGTAVNADDADAMLNRLRGPVDSQVRLGILHDKASVPTVMSLTRERIKVASVRTRMLDPGYAEIRISEFQQRTGEDLRHQLQQLVAKHGPLRGVVLDLRSNPGGLVSAAVDVADSFIDSGVIVSTRGRLAQSHVTFNASPGDLLNGAPMVVLVDQGTASAAEIVAGALKDHHRALIMGQQTFGKGSVQTVLPIGDGDALKLTTARYYTPAGHSIQARGISPDIDLADLAIAPRDTPPTPILTEADLPHHLQAGTGPAAVADATAAKPLALDDYAMSAALHVLKGLAIARRN
ncbi:MAG: S41 family peptidase [Xanthomonadales bacterium]|nr:S41 family peptidase [Xanthomonadales bacterium]